MARQFTVRARIEAQDAATSEVARVENRFRRFSRFLSTGYVAGTLAAALSIRGLVRAFRSVISASEEQEDAVRSLDQALAPLGARAESVSKSLQQQAAALQQLTTVGDETIIRGQALLSAFTKSEAAIKGATQAALDLSAGTGQDLNSAFLLLGRAAAGSTETLSRYGIILQEGLSDSEKFAAALKQIEDRFGGQAQAKAETFRGKMSQLGNVIGDAAEKIGDAVTQSDEFGGAIDGIRQAVERNEGPIGRLAEKVATLALNLGKVIVEGANLLATPFSQAELLAERLQGRLGGVEVSAAAVEATAKRLGITVEEVRARMAEAAGPVGEVTAGLEAQKDAAEAATEALDGLTGKTDEAAKASKALSTALGEVTSLELEQQIRDINAELAQEKQLLGENTAEYQHRAELASEAIEKLRARIDSLQAGQGDLLEQTTETTTGLALMGRGAEDAAAGVDTLNASLGRTAGNAAAVEASVRLSARAFDDLAESIGRAAAVQQALESGGATLSSGGRRINLAGGSRLVAPFDGGGSGVRTVNSVIGGNFTSIGAPLGYLIDQGSGELVRYTSVGAATP